MLPPGPPKHRKRDILRTARSIRALAKDPIAFVGGRFDEYGDIYHVDEGGGSHLFVTCNPAILHQVLVTDGQRFRKGGANELLVPVLGRGLLTADGELWKKQRRLIQPAFHAKSIAGYARTMVEHAAAIDWQDGARIDVSEAMIDLTLRIVCKTLFDHDVRDDSDTIAGTMDALRTSVRPSLLPQWIPTPSRIRAKRVIAELDVLIEDLVRERRGNLRHDLLSQLLDVDPPMEPKQLRDEMLTLFLAGHETTSHALTWTWYLLSQNPEAEAALHRELDSVLGDRSPTRDDLAALPYTEAVVTESMRLFPPAFAVVRVATEDVPLVGTDYVLKEGWQAACWMYWAHHDARWFDDPEAFRPERWLGDPELPKGAYLPFGAGTRMCIGAGFAKMELRLLLAELARRYVLRLAPDARIERRARITLAPRYGMPMTVSTR